MSTGAVRGTFNGPAVALSADCNTVIVSGLGDNGVEADRGQYCQIARAIAQATGVKSGTPRREKEKMTRRTARLLAVVSTTIMIMILITTALRLGNLPALGRFHRGGHGAAPVSRADGHPSWADMNLWGALNLGQLEIFRLCGSAHGQQRTSRNNNRGSRHSECYLHHLRLLFPLKMIRTGLLSHIDADQIWERRRDRSL
ncbi:MAG: hypothetical protein ABSC37_00905 [Xanthobacteraceae bacterium]